MFSVMFLGVVLLFQLSLPATALQDDSVPSTANPQPSSAARELQPAVDPTALSQWWQAAGRLRLGDTVYRIDPEKELEFRDGVCSAELKSGFLVPVITGEAPVSEKIVGYVFSGEGNLNVRFPERGDAWAFANHMVRRAGRGKSEFTDVAHQRA